MYKMMFYIGVCCLISCKSKTPKPDQDISKSVSITYYDEGDTLVKSFMSFNKYAQINGPYVRFYKNGNIRSVENYIEGVLYGEALYFYKNGRLSFKVNYKDGKKDGKSYSFFPSGSKKDEMIWEKDVQVGYSLVFFDSTENLKYLMFHNDSGYVWYKKEYDQNHNVIKEEGKQKLTNTPFYPKF